MSGILAHVLVAVEQFFGGLSGRWQEVSALVREHFGPSGPWVLWGVVAFIILFFVSKATKLAYDLLRLVVLPSAALCIAISMLLPCWPPMRTFPVFLAVTTAMMFFREK